MPLRDLRASCVVHPGKRDMLIGVINHLAPEGDPILIIFTSKQDAMDWLTDWKKDRMYE